MIVSIFINGFLEKIIFEKNKNLTYHEGSRNCEQDTQYMDSKQTPLQSAQNSVSGNGTILLYKHNESLQKFESKFQSK